MKSNTGIYEILNTTNGHRYIGSSLNVDARLKGHMHKLATGKHCNIHLQRSWNMYGEHSFVMRPILYCDPQMSLIYEQMCIDGLFPEYNIAKNVTAPMTGLSHTEEQKKKIGERARGNTNNLGKVVSEERRKQMSEAGKGRVQSAETRTKKIASLKAYFSTHTRTLSEDHKRKIRAANTGKKMPEETKAKISEAKKAYWAEKRAGCDL